MIQRQIKLRFTPRQARQMEHWLYHLTAIWNWGIKRIERDAEIGIYHNSLRFRDLLNGHGRKLGISQDALCGTLWTVHTAWQRCFKRLANRPRFKGRRNRLNSIAYAHGTTIVNGRVMIPGIGRVRFHKQEIPQGRISQLRVVRRSSGWYACLFIRAEPNDVPVVANNEVGIDPGFRSLLTLSTGEKFPHPRELEASALRLAQAQRGKDRKIVGRIQERVANRRRDRNHKLSRRLVSENRLIAFSADDHSAIAGQFGKSVTSSGHYQLRRMLASKMSRRDGGRYIEVSNRNFTKTCSNCGALSGPSGLRTLAVRQWRCDCGSLNDRDVNAAVNTLIAALGGSVERRNRRLKSLDYEARESQCIN
jgi:putative transposase